MMKKICFILFVFLFFLSENALATFTIERDLPSIDFGNVNRNQTVENVPPQGVTVTCTSDEGEPWFLRIRLDGGRPLTHISNDASIIPNEDFYWCGTFRSGTGTLTEDEQNFLTEGVVYSAPAGEGADGIDIRIKFKLVVPPRLQSGTYTTGIIFTLTE